MSTSSHTTELGDTVKPNVKVAFELLVATCPLEMMHLDYTPNTLLASTFC